MAEASEAIRHDFPRLLEPLRVNQVTLRNRIVKPAQVLGFAAEDGNASAMQLAHYEALAQGGVGLLIVESSCVDYPIGGKGENRLRIDDDAFMPSFSRLAAAIHAHACPTFLQLSHNGPAAKFASMPPLAASALSAGELPVSDPRVAYDPPRAMTLADIERSVEKHAAAAWRAKQCGFDGVEVHAGHSYLVNSFLSRAWNRRDDDYGAQSFENRARFAADIVRAIRARVGSDFAIGMRVNGEEWGHELGITSEESVAFATILERAGLDIIHVTGWGYGYGAYSWVQYPEQLLYPEPSVPLARLVRKPGVIASRAAAIKQAVKIPVIAVGSLGPALGERVLRHGMADAIAMGRRLMADPALPRKLLEGRPEDIRPCMACLECRTAFGRYRPAACRVNAALGREQEYAIRPVAAKKRVVVVGGGPAGMEAARVAAARGHAVVLYEKSHRLGGSMPLAALIKSTTIEDLPALIAYFETQLRKLGVRIMLRRELTAPMARALNPDVIIVAAGGQDVSPRIPGIERTNVLSGATLGRLAAPYLRLFGPRVLGGMTRFWLPVGKRVVVVGGLLQGCQSAAFLVKRGRQVTVVEESAQLGEGIPTAMKPRLLDWLAEKGVTMLTRAQCREITAQGVVVRTSDGGVQTLPADSVITALPLAPNPALAEALAGGPFAVHSAGDCVQGRTILHAIHDGARVGNSI
ncbi:MAG: FAD-dependent oxidoreductase [Burkholderiales bacterium]|nr:FAD-dependent oxidoreductase [Burkholderiales bacterium]